VSVVSARMLQGSYEETAPVEFKLKRSDSTGRVPSVCPLVTAVHCGKRRSDRNAVWGGGSRGSKVPCITCEFRSPTPLEGTKPEGNVAAQYNVSGEYGINCAKTAEPIEPPF